MRIGFDLDSVFADFQSAYIQRYIDRFPDNLFPEAVVSDPNNFIPTWYYPQYFGYTDDQDKLVWDDIKMDPYFWETLDALDTTYEVFDSLPLRGHDYYFITDRRGHNVKQQTENWLDFNGWVAGYPTVIVTADKATIARALKLDAFIDDKPDHVNAVAREGTRTFVLDRGWNRPESIPFRGYSPEILPTVTRVKSVTEFLVRAGVLLEPATIS